MKLFTLDENYEIKPERDTVMLVPEFKELWSLAYNKNKGDVDGRKRIRARAEMTYMYFACDYRSEYSGYSESEREVESKAAAGLPEDYPISPELVLAKTKYMILQETRELKLLKSAYSVIDKLEEYFNDLKVDNKNISSIFASLAKIGDTFANLKKLEEQVRKQQQESKGIRGAGEPGYLD